MDVTSMIDYNLQQLDREGPTNAFFYLSKDNSDVGFPYDATSIAGHAFPSPSDHEVEKSQISSQADARDTLLHQRLILGSQLAQFLRHELETQMGYTSSVGISTSKLLAKLVGNVNKPRNQTTLLPPYDEVEDEYGNFRASNVQLFLGDHDIRKIPGIGSKLARRLKEYVLERQKDDEAAIGTVTVKQLRCHPDMDQKQLEIICQGHGFPRVTGLKVWGLLNGIDPSPVTEARELPTQISIENSYGCLERLDDLRRELHTLSIRLINRMRIDLTVSATKTFNDGSPQTTTDESQNSEQRWLAKPRTLRLSTRPSRSSSFSKTSGSKSFNSMARASRSCPMPQFIFSFQQSMEALADTLVKDALMPLFQKLHPPCKAWKISLLNIAATNMVTVQASSPFVASADQQHYSGTAGQNIGNMLRGMQAEVKLTPGESTIAQDVSKAQRLDGSSVVITPGIVDARGTESVGTTGMYHDEDGWMSDSEDAITPDQKCDICSVYMPSFAADAHRKFHQLSDS